MRARSRKDLTPFTRDLEIQHGAPRTNADGTVELHPVRFLSFPLSVEGIKEKIERFESYVTQCVTLGATKIFWS